MYDRALGVAEWAKRWGTSRTRARKALAVYRQQFGSEVVQRRGPQRRYVMTVTAWERVRRDDDLAPAVQKDLKAMGARLETQMAHGFAELWKEIRAMRAMRGAFRDALSG